MGGWFSRLANIFNTRKWTAARIIGTSVLGLLLPETAGSSSGTSESIRFTAMTGLWILWGLRIALPFTRMADRWLATPAVTAIELMPDPGGDVATVWLSKLAYRERPPLPERPRVMFGMGWLGWRRVFEYLRFAAGYPYHTPSNPLDGKRGWSRVVIWQLLEALARRPLTPEAPVARDYRLVSVMTSPSPSPPSRPYLQVGDPTASKRRGANRPVHQNDFWPDRGMARAPGHCRQSDCIRNALGRDGNAVARAHGS